MPEAASSLLLDLSVVAVCIMLLVGFARLRHSHPAVIYLAYHLVIVTPRLASLAAGAPPLFSLSGSQLIPVRPEEIARAAIWSDVALAIMTMTWIVVAARGQRPAPRRKRLKPQPPPLMLRPQVIRIV